MQIRRPRPRRAHAPYWLLGASVAAAFAAVLPIAFALIGGVGGKGVPSRAFAQAPPGLSVVGVRAAELEDILVVAPVSALGDIREIAHIPHLPGYISTGAVSPDGRSVAVVSADGGTPAQPSASLYVVDIATGELHRRAENIDALQTAVWSRDGAALYVTRTGGAGTLVDVEVVRVPIDGSAVSRAATFGRVLGAYPIGEGAGAGLLTVVINAAGSTLLRADGTVVLALSPAITRDWKLSPDGAQLAFIEANLERGLQYIQRVVRLEGSAERSGNGAAQTAASGEQLGVAWAPRATAPTFGQEPGGRSANAVAQSNADGFDVPLAFSPEGAFLAVQAWSGDSFQSPGEVTLEAVASDGGRAEIPFTRFFGWASR